MVGSCFYYDTPPHGAHPWVVIAPGSRPGWFVCVNITTRRSGVLSACELLRDEHPMLTSPVSIPVFNRARELPLPLIERHVTQSGFPKFDPPLMARIHSAAVARDSALPNPLKRIVLAFVSSLPR